MDCSPPEGVFDAEVETLVAGGIPILFSRMSGFFYSRDMARLRSDSLDHFGLLISRDISFSGNAAGWGYAGGPGQLLVGDFARPIEQASTDGTAISIVVPRAVAQAVVPALETMHGRVVGGIGVGLLADFLDSVRSRASAIGPDEAPAVSSIVLDLIALALSPHTAEVGSQPGPADATRFWMAYRIIEAELDRTDLGAELLMSRLRIGRSTLYRLFEPHGGVAGYIRQRRLARAADMLSRPGHRERIAVIARRCGFPDQASFSRAFRTAFGCPPSEFYLLAGGAEGAETGARATKAAQTRIK